MNVWAISDLHLSFANPIRRERYAARWRDHANHIERSWREVVKRGDLVLVPGDISTARNHRDLQPDFAWLDRLPGTKVMSPGNHDRWWNGLAAIRPLLRRTMLAVEGDALATHGIVVCGARGASVMADQRAPADPASQARELEQLDRSLQLAGRMRDNSGVPLYVLWHFPPFDAHGRPGPCVERFERAGVSACVYGHLHNQSQWAIAMQGSVRGVRYHCVAADAIGFRPIRIATFPDPRSVDGPDP